MRRFVFIYARSDSSRLPGKTFMPLAGRMLIDIVVDRALRVGADGCALLTSCRSIDDQLAEHGKMRGLRVVRGHSTDLVERTLLAIEETKATHFLRVNGDSPLFSPELAHYAMLHIKDVDIISNILCRRFPYGVAVEWISSSIYKELSVSALADEREHVTQHLYRQIGKLNNLSLEQKRDDSKLRLTLDTPIDYEKLKKMLEGQDISSLPYWHLLNLEAPEPFLVCF